MPRWDEPGLTFDNPLFHYDDPRSVAEILNTQQTKAMFDVVLDIKSLSVPDLVLRAKAIRKGIADTPVFSSLSADLTALDGLITTLETLQTDQATAKAAFSNATAARDAGQGAVNAALNKLASNIAKLATTEAQVISAQMRLKEKPGPKPIPDTPTGLELTMGDEDGELSGHCNGQSGIVEYYEIRYTTSDPLLPATTWQFADTSKKSSFDLANLPSGQKVWVQLRACNARGKSGWCDPACKRVP